MTNGRKEKVLLMKAYSLWNDKILIDARHSTVKKIFSFLTTVILWCMGLGKNSEIQKKIRLEPHWKKETLFSECG